MLRISLRDRDVPLWLNTPARDVIIEDGRVDGDRGRRRTVSPSGSARTAASIFAAGGFEGNQTMREKYLPNPDPRRSGPAGNPHNTGDVIEMGTQAQARRSS